ncbi:hypothetical protein [Sulfitobacter aestuariivivens]
MTRLRIMFSHPSVVIMAIACAAAFVTLAVAAPGGFGAWCRLACWRKC